MALEGGQQKAIWLAVAKVKTTLFRLNSGKGWISNLGPVKGISKHLDGSVLVKAARPVALGMGMLNGDSVPGQSDLGGWTEVVITQEMVGATVAVFTTIECKKLEGGRTSKTQMSFVDRVIAAGGIAGVANCPEAALAIIQKWKDKFFKFVV